MNEILTHLLNNILYEAKVKGVRVSSTGQRVVNFDSEENLRRRIEKSNEPGVTYRTYNPQTDSHLKVGKDTPAQSPPAVVKPAPKKQSVSKKPAKDTASDEPKSAQTRPAPGGIGTLNSTSLAQQIRRGIVAPGNDFSRYSEAVSIFVSKYIVDNPDASDEDIMAKLTELDCDSATLNTKVAATIPRRLKSQYDSLQKTGAFSSGCSKKYSEKQNRARFMTMVVAKQKARRMQAAITKTKLTGVSVDSFSGDQDSLAAMRKLIEESTGKFYSETGQEIDKQTMLEFVGGFGTAKFPADTALVGRDSNGNVIFMGFSDKKDLNAIINNSTVTKEFDRTASTLDSLRRDGKITEEQHSQATSDMAKLTSDYEEAERKLRTVTTSPATRLVEIASSSPKDLKPFIDRAKSLSRGSTPDKYWKEVISGPFEAAATGKGRHKSKLKYLEMAGWKAGDELTDEIMLTAFAHMAKETLESDDPDVSLTKDAQEVLFRLGVVDAKEMVEQVGKIRIQALEIIGQTREALNKITVNGLPLGTLMDGIRAWKGLHLDMDEYAGTLSMVAEDVVVDYESIQECLGGVSQLSDFTKTLKISSRDITSKEHGITTGANIEVFSVAPSGERVNVGVRSIRSKEGILGRLQTTWTYHPEFQDCLASKK